MSLRWRVAAGLAVIAALVCALAAAGAYVSTSRQLQAGVDESLVARAHDAFARNDHPPGRPRAGGQVAGPGRVVVACPAPGALQPASAAQLVSADGVVVSCIDGGPTLPVSDGDLSLAADGGSSVLRTVSVDGARYRVLTVPWFGGTALQTARNLGEADRVLRQLRLRLALLALAGVGAAALLGWLAARRIVRPVEDLRDAAEKIARTQDLATPVPRRGSGEVGSLARSFTTMVGALASSREQQRRLVSDASHELRTPLTSVRTNVELLRRAEDLPADQRREVLDDLQFEVQELTDLVAELVELATDRSSSDEPVETVSLAELACTVAARAARRTGREVRVVDAGGPSVIGRPQMLERAIANLVDNALKYSPPTGPVEVEIRGGRLEVLDRGPGVAPVDQPRVFDRFYRATSARTAPGSGLGLAIVKQIVERHDGRVWATDRPGGGAAVGFELPAACAPAPAARARRAPDPG